VHRALETLRAAMNWGMAQTPPLFMKSPFHRFGVRMNKKLETTRDRRLTRDGVDIRIVQLMLGHASIQQTQRYLNVTDEELRRGLEVSWNNKGRPLRAVSA
jgi:integrase